jgi:predicted outer membrane repeat protein
MNRRTGTSFITNIGLAKNLLRSISINFGGLAVALFVTMIAALPAHANETITVDTSTEESVVFGCSLRSAILNHNAGGVVGVNTCLSGANNTTIQFNTLSNDIFMGSPLPPIQGGLLIDGSNGGTGPIVLHGAYIEVAAGAGLALDHVNTIYNALDFQKNISPFAVDQGASLEFRSGDYTNNSGLPPGVGGIIFNNGGDVSIGSGFPDGNIRIHDGRATTAGGDIYNNGGTVEIGGSDLTFGQFSVENGSAPNGGGIYSTGGAISISGGIFTNNQASSSGQGGAIYSTHGSLVVAHSTFRGNSAGVVNGGRSGNGGAIYIANDTVATVKGSTFDRNNASGTGGAIFFNTNTAIPLVVTNSTFYDVGSSFTSADDIHVSGAQAQVTFSTMQNGGLGTDNAATIKLRNSIVFGNATCEGDPSTFVDAGHNLQFATSPTCPSTIPILNPLLDPNGLQNNGGNTRTVALTKGSPAINAIGTANCTDQSGKRVLLDQRNYTRPASPFIRCDIGAYEYNAKPATPRRIRRGSLESGSIDNRPIDPGA